MIDMGQFISLPRRKRADDGGLRVRKRCDQGLREVRDLSANRVQADKASAARWDIGDVSNITLEEAPGDWPKEVAISISRVTGLRRNLHSLLICIVKWLMRLRSSEWRLLIYAYYDW